LDIALGVVQVSGVVMLFGLISPQGRQIISGIGFLAICILGVSLFGLIGFGVYRFLTRSQRAEIVARSVDWKLLRGDVNSKQKLPQAAADLNEQIRTIDWFQFEKLVAIVYRKRGYAVTHRGGANPDGGIDLVIEKNGQHSAVQCKQWKSWNVGVKAVREFLGALTDAGISKGIFITLCGYTGEAKQLADKHGIEIVNEAGLVKMIEGTDARFDPEMLAILDDTLVRTRIRRLRHHWHRYYRCCKVETAADCGLRSGRADCVHPAQSVDRGEA
jgi:hypothetical protein